MKSLLNLLVIWGTRPEAIKWRPWSSWQRCPFSMMYMHTKQHIDQSMLGKSSQGKISNLKENRSAQFTGDYTNQEALNQYADSFYKQNKIDAVLVWGDTSTALWGALWAKKNSVPVIHFEAGLRSGLANQPEEANRRRIDSVSHLYICPHESAKENLLHEGWLTVKDQSRALVVNELPFWSIPQHFRKRLFPTQESALSGILATLHRYENIENPDSLAYWIASIEQLATKYPITWIMHPHTLDCIQRFHFKLPTGIAILKPQSQRKFFDLLQMHRLLITDSGGAFVEGQVLGRTVCCFRPAVEWQWLLKEGISELSPPRERKLVSQVSRMLESPIPSSTPIPTLLPGLHKISLFIEQNIGI